MADRYGERHSALRGWAQLLIAVGIVAGLVGVVFAFTAQDGAVLFGAVSLTVLGSGSLVAGSVFAAVAITLRPDRSLPKAPGGQTP